MSAMPLSATLTPSLQLDYVRDQFPALAGDWTFFDNAGGSQILKGVGDRLQDFLYTSNVQLGASYGVSQLASQRVAEGSEAMAKLINAADPSEVVLGNSTSSVLRILAHCWGQSLNPGDEIIVTNSDHEANISPWRDLQSQGVTLKTWCVNPDTFELDLADLAALLTDKTRMVAVTQTSNLLGTLNPIRPIADLVHNHGALLCVDGVAYAPHRLIDVQAWDVDFYAFSLYKVYGPHLGLLYGKREHLLPLPGFNHSFIGPEVIPYKLQPGGVSYELTASLPGIVEYLQGLAQHHWGADVAPDIRGQLTQAFDLIAAHEAQLSDRLLTYLRSKPQVRIIGCDTADPQQRVPTIAFVVAGRKSSEIPPYLDAEQIGIRYGHFYAPQLVEDLGLAEQDGVVRVSMVHYNTLDECDRLIAALGTVL